MECCSVSTFAFLHLLGFAINGYFALKIFFDYFARLIIKGDFDFTKNNNLTQMISIFALAMVAVGFAAPDWCYQFKYCCKCSWNIWTMFSLHLQLCNIYKIILGFKNMFEHGVTVETAHLYGFIPILTLLGITFID